MGLLYVRGHAVTGCSFPQHHRGGGGPGWLTAAAVLVAACAAVRLVLAAVRFIEAWWWVAVVVLAAAVVAWCGIRLRKTRPLGARNPHLKSALRHLPRTVWAAARWRHLVRNLALAYPDKHRQGTVRHPRALILPGPHGPVARVRTVPGSGRAEFDQAAGHIANAWRCSRVSVSQPKPGRLVVRGLKRDPLLEVFGTTSVQSAGVFGTASVQPRMLYLGRDEHGQDRFADLANVPGICVGGMPGSGKSTEITAWLTQLAPSPAVQFALADGKGAGEFDDFACRAYAMAGDDLDEVIDLLEKQHALMTDRLAAVRSVLGVKNAWHVGPTADWALAVTILDECQSYLDLAAVKGDRALEAKVRRIIFLASSLIRRGRSVMMLTVVATQKPTTDSLPSSIRDNCPLALSFAVRTVDAAAASLGSAIRDFPSYSPTGLALPDYTGVATATLRTGQDPFTRLRGPWVTEDQAAAAAAASAHLRKDPRASLPIVVPDDASSLDPTSAGA